MFQNHTATDSQGIEILPWNGRSAAVSLTFDDAQPSHIAHLDTLTATGVPMTFFVNSNVSFPGSDEAWRRAVASGHELGCHTASHPHMPSGQPMGEGIFGKTEASPEDEMERCDRFILDTAGQRRVWTFASPYGDEGWEPLAGSRYALVRSVANGTVPAENDPLYEDIVPTHLPCHMAMPGESAQETFIPLIERSRDERSWLIFCFHSILPTEENWFAGVGIDEITESVRHALGRKDVWVDTFANIGSYWLARKAVHAAAPASDARGLEWKWDVIPGLIGETSLLVRARGGDLFQGATRLKARENGLYDVLFSAGNLRLEFR